MIRQILLVIYKADARGFHPGGRFAPSSFGAVEKRMCNRLCPLFRRCIDGVVVTRMLVLCARQCEVLGFRHDELGLRREWMRTNAGLMNCDFLLSTPVAV